MFCCLWLTFGAISRVRVEEFGHLEKSLIFSAVSDKKFLNFLERSSSHSFDFVMKRLSFIHIAPKHNSSGLEEL